MDFDRFRNSHLGTPGKVEFDITWRSIFRVLGGVLLAYVAVVLWPIFKLLILAALIAVALSPLMRRLCARGCPRWLGLAITAALLALIVIGFVLLVAPVVYRQAVVLADNLPKIRDQVLAQLPPSGMLHKAMENGINPEAVSDSRRFLEHAVDLARSTVGGLVEFVMVLALAVYLIADGPGIARRFTLCFPARLQEKAASGLVEVSNLVFAYVAGQTLISALCAAYVFVLLRFLGVPMALLLGIIAGACDVIPLLGFLVAVTLMAIVAFTVSPATAGLVFCFYGGYHLFENFVILPRVYGSKLKLSPVTVPLAIAAGALLAGVIGAIAALPAVAAFPVIEKLWAREPENLEVKEPTKNPLN